MNKEIQQVDVVTLREFYRAQLETGQRIGAVELQVREIHQVVRQIHKTLHADNGERGLATRVDHLEAASDRCPFGQERGPDMARRIEAMERLHDQEAGSRRLAGRWGRLVQFALQFLVGLTGVLVAVYLT